METKEYDETSGLVYFGARYYHPQIGRFISPDPLGMAEGTNLYAYCHNDPINLIDPWGLCVGNNYWWWIVGGIGTSALPGFADDAAFWGAVINVGGGLAIINWARGGRQNLRDSGLQGLTDQEVSSRARDKSLSGSERRRYQREEKARKYRNREKRKERGF